MKVLNNKKGSALLWTILLSVIITILLGAVLTASYAYYNYTMYTVKRQQAYFTARSATNALLEEFSDQEQKAQTAPGGGVTYVDVDPDVLPDRNSTVDISDFGFPSSMGTATAKLERGDGDEVDITVNATYADQEYTMKSTVVRQPLYFSGVAIKQITLNGNLTLGENTDLYWNNTNTFDLRSQTGYNIKISGNLVTKGDAVIKSGSQIAHHKFTKDVNFSKANNGKYLRKIWSPSEYIISNKTLTAADNENVEYVSSVINTISNITNYTLKYCNNSQSLMNNYFGFPSVLDTEGMQKLLEFLGMSDIYTDMKNGSMSITDQSNDALAIKYIKLLSLSQQIKNQVDEKKNDDNWLTRFIANGFDRIMGDFIENNGLRVFDASYIEFNARNENTRDDDVIPIVYLFVDGGPENGLNVRIKYGKDPQKESNLFNYAGNIEDAVAGFIENVFKIKNNMSYVIVYLEENSTIELGTLVGGRNNNPEDLVFAYSIYGGDNTTAILNDGVTVLGEVYCDHLIVKGDAKIIYTNSSGSQIAKQKVAEYWTIVNYSD